MLPAIDRPDLSVARRIREALGEVLRETRRHRGLTLREVAALAGSRFKPSAIGGYERGERSISLERFCDLAELYGVPADRLLAQVLARVKPEGRVEVVVDLTQLELLPGEEPRITAELVDRVRRQRGDLTGAQVTLRAGDLEALALASKLAPGDLVRRLQPALQLRGDQSRSES
jgi:transcriptional regulator with XRE-family HTH domain